MLVFSGLGSLRTERHQAFARAALVKVVLVIVAWCAAMLLFLEPLILATLDWPFIVRTGLLLLLVAPVSVALGLPFPLGLSKAGTGGFLPWAWGLNGAFSVVATPLANLIAREYGFSRVLLCAAILYAIALATFPAMRKRSGWHDIPAPSPAAH